MTITTEIDYLPEDVLTDEVEIGQGEIQFEPTGIEHKDKAIAGMINDAPNACKDLMRAKVWDKVCQSANPAGAAEMELLTILNVPENIRKPVLIKLKTMLGGLRLSVPQAHHKCVLEKNLKRINMEKIALAKPKKTPIVIGDKETKLDGSILTHPDGSTYTFGTRGRRPLWVTEWLTTNTAPEISA